MDKSFQHTSQRRCFLVAKLALVACSSSFLFNACGGKFEAINMSAQTDTSGVNHSNQIGSNQNESNQDQTGGTENRLLSELSSPSEIYFSVTYQLDLSKKGADGVRVRSLNYDDSIEIYFDGELVEKGMDLPQTPVKFIGLRIPFVESNPKDAKLQMELTAGAELFKVDWKLNPRISPCDNEAGDPNDPYHVGEGKWLVNSIGAGQTNLVDFIKGVPACEKAIENFPKEGRFLVQLAGLYRTQKKYAESLELLTQAQALEDPLAYSGLAIHYQEGLGVEKDLKKSCEYRKLSGESGHLGGLHGYAECLRLGTGDVKVDLVASFEWQERAAEGGFHWAMEVLGKYYANAWGVDRDWDKAYYWRQAAAAKNNGWAIMELGRMYEGAQGRERDMAKAINYFERAQALGVHWASVYLARIFRLGTGGVTIDLLQAEAYYKLAIDAGNPVAEEELKEMKSNKPAPDPSPIPTAKSFSRPKVTLNGKKFDIRGTQVSADAFCRENGLQQGRIISKFGSGGDHNYVYFDQSKNQWIKAKVPGSSFVANFYIDKLECLPTNDSGM